MNDTKEIRVVVIDDHQLFRAGVRAELSPHVTIVGEAGDPASAVQLIGTERPNVALLDVHMSNGGGLAVLRAFCNDPNAPAFLALSVSDHADDVVPMVREGALGYVTKTIETDLLVEAIRTVSEGDAYFRPKLAAFVLRTFTEAEPAGDDGELARLTPREREVLQQIARGYTYKQIGLRLEISPRTVEAHVSSVLRKLQLSTRHELSHWATSKGLVHPHD